MKEKKFPIITVILIIGVCISLGYFMIFKSGMKFSDDEIVELEKNWKINIKVSDKSFENSTSDIKINNTNIKINGHLDNKDSIIKYILEINNNGTIDANLYSIMNSNQDVEISLLSDNKNLEEGTIIKAKEKKKVELTIKSTKDEKLDFENELKLIFNQYNN